MDLQYAIYFIILSVCTYIYEGGEFMLVERISDDKIKFVLSEDDLQQRNISIEDLITQTPDVTHPLFQEITQKLYSDYGFSSIGTPLVFQATVTNGSITILVSRVTKKNGTSIGGIVPNLETSDFMIDSLLPRSRRNKPEHNDDDGLDDIVNAVMGKNFGKKKFAQAKNIDGVPLCEINARKKRVYAARNKVVNERAVFSFKCFDDMAGVTKYLTTIRIYDSHAYKMNGQYYLVIFPLGTIDVIPYLDELLGEFGERHSENPLIDNILKECGEVIIANDAIDKLREYMDSSM